MRVPATGISSSSLVLVNGVNLCNSTLSQLRALQVSEGIPIRHIFTPGDWHHVYLAQYNTHFPHATVYVPPGRIPAQHDVGLNYTLLDVMDPAPFLQPHMSVIPMLGLRQPAPHWGTPRCGEEPY